LVSCDAVSDELPFMVDGNRRPSRAMQEHLESCLSCQAELAGYRRLLRALRALRDQPLQDVPELLGATLNALHGHPSWPARRPARWWALAGALAAAGVAAVGAGALVLRSRQGRSFAPA
jgi:anti-sigma factor RsiW